MPKRLHVAGLFAVVCLSLFSGCERSRSPLLGAETDESDYRLGQRLVKQGQYQGALAAYLRVIDERGDAAPESHLEVGILYLQQMKDPIAAIYHFRQYLERLPNSPQAPQVRGLVESAKREFARTLPADPLESQSDRLNMLDQIDQLKREIDQLKGELAIARGGGADTRPVSLLRSPADQADAALDNQVAPPPAPVDSSPLSLAPITPDATPTAAPVRRTTLNPAPTTAQPTSPTGRRHTIVKGDTLFSLAQRYYGNRSKWRDIYDANRDQLSSENSLRIGMELKIP